MTILTPPRPITHQAPRLTPRSDAQPTLEAWRVVGWVGIAFVVMGFTDVALAWYPAAFGNPEWEFGAISATLNGFALPTLGLYLVLASSLARSRKLPAVAAAGLAIALVVALLVLAFIYVTVIPLALRSVAHAPLIASGMKKAIVKAIVLFLSYGVLFAAAAMKGLRRRAV
jgi:hypothetical protein